MEKKPILSVVMPVYNAAQYLSDSIESVLHQSLYSLELILVDDGSTDSSYAICEKYRQKDSRVKTISQKNAGPGMARNAGLELATGKYVIFIDSDDLVELFTYEKMVAEAEKHCLDIVTIQFERFCDTAKIKHYPNRPSTPIIYDTLDKIKKSALCIFSQPVWDEAENYNIGGSACCAMCKTDLLKINGIKCSTDKSAVSEDYIFRYQSQMKAEKVAMIPEKLYHYRINPNSFSLNPNPDRIKKLIDFSHRVEKMTAEYGQTVEGEQYAMGYCLNNIRTALKMYFMSGVSLREKKEWFDKQQQDGYIEKIYRNYPWQKLPLRHKLNFWLFYNRCFVLLYTLIVGQEKLRKLLGKI